MKKRYYYFALANNDPLVTSYPENSISLDELERKYVNTWIKTGDEDHDWERICAIWTEDQVDAYYNA